MLTGTIIKPVEIRFSDLVREGGDSWRYVGLAKAEGSLKLTRAMLGANGEPLPDRRDFLEMKFAMHGLFACSAWDTHTCDFFRARINREKAAA